jgi:sugar-specific transcriptional regulator TrmB
MTHNGAQLSLSGLGFNETEAAVYCELLHAPATGYRLAQAVGKSPPNVYHALGALHQKGAVVADDSDGRVYRAVPAGELLGILEKQFELRREEARRALTAIETHVPDDRIYHLKTVDQLYARARRMIADASEILLFDIFPGIFEALRGDLATAAAAGIRVAGTVYAEADEPAMRLVLSRHPPAILTRWPGQQLSIVADAREHLLALLSHDGGRVHHALWSDGIYLSTLQHNALASEIRLSAVMPNDEDALADLALLRAFPPGLRTLVGAENMDQWKEAV